MSCTGRMHLNSLKKSKVVTDITTLFISETFEYLSREYTKRLIKIAKVTYISDLQ